MKYLALALSLAVIGCNQAPPPVQYAPAPAPQVQYAPAPQVVQAAPSGNGLGELALAAGAGALAGHLLSKNGAPAAAPASGAAAPQVINNRTVIIKQVAAPVAPIAPLVAKPAAVVPAAPVAEPAPVSLAKAPALVKTSYAPAYRATPTVTYRQSAPSSSRRK